MKYIHTLGLALFLTLVFSCSKPTAESEETSDTTLVDEAVNGDMDALQEEPDINNIVDYQASLDDELKMKLATFQPLEDLLTVTNKTLDFKDSVFFAQGDTSVFTSRVNTTYDLILEYKKAIKAGITSTDAIPKLTDIKREAGASDRTRDFLPTAEKSTALANSDFFFLGGAPFIYKHDNVFKGPDGKPENRYFTSITENANFFFNSIYKQVGGAIDVTFGPELNTYESTLEIRGIGSLIHTFENRIPVYFITEQGPVRAHLVSATFKLAPQGLGCISDQPRYEFASPVDLNPFDILFVYVPYPDHRVMTSAVRTSKALWWADINGDDIPDFACVSGTFDGLNDVLNETLWYANVNGEWIIIDFGTDPDCT